MDNTLYVAGQIGMIPQVSQAVRVFVCWPVCGLLLLTFCNCLFVCLFVYRLENWSVEELKQKLIR